MTTARAATAQRQRRRGSMPYFAKYPLRWRVLLSQLPLTISAVLVTLAVLLVEPRVATSSPHLLGGLGGILALTVAASAVPWQKFSPVVHWVIPLQDFVAIAPFWSAARYVLDGMSVLTAFPVFWLAWSGVYPVLAISVSFLGSTVVAWWLYVAEVSLFAEEVVRPGLARPAMVPFLMLALAVALSILTRSLERQSRELTASLDNAATQNRMLRTVAESSEVGMLVVDRDGHDVLMNAAQRRTHFLGLPSGFPDGAEADLLMFEADGTTPIPAADRPVVRALRGESLHDRIIALGTDGNQQHLSVSAAPMVDTDGAFDGTVVIFQNVTDLIGAIQAREQFVAEVTHEFRTPLTSIIGYLDPARDANPDPAIERYLSTSIRNAERLLTLVTNLLDASSSTSAIAVQEVDLAQLTRHSPESAAVRAQHAGVLLDAELPARLGVMADAVKLGQVVDNLLSTPSSTPRRGPRHGLTPPCARGSNEGRGPGCRRAGRTRGPRHRDRVDEPGARRALHQLLPHGARTQGRDPRHRARARDLPGLRPCTRRGDPGVITEERGIDVHGTDPGRGTACEVNRRALPTGGAGTREPSRFFAAHWGRRHAVFRAREAASSGPVSGDAR